MAEAGLCQCGVQQGAFVSVPTNLCATAHSCVVAQSVSDSSQPHGLQHARLPCPSPTPGVNSNSQVHRVGDAIQPSHPLSSPSPPAFNLSQHQGFSSDQLAKYWSFNIGISPSNEYSGLISFRMDWLDLLAVRISPHCKEFT